MAYALRESGARILLLERGDFLPQESQNWQVEAVFGENRYKPAERWIDASNGAGFKPGVHYYVGGNTKVYGAPCLASAARTSRRWNMKVARRPPGPSAMKTWNLITTLPRTFFVHGNPAMTPANRRVRDPILSPKCHTNPISPG